MGIAASLIELAALGAELGSSAATAVAGSAPEVAAAAAEAGGAAADAGGVAAEAGGAAAAEGGGAVAEEGGAVAEEGGGEAAADAGEDVGEAKKPGLLERAGKRFATARKVAGPVDTAINLGAAGVGIAGAAGAFSHSQPKGAHNPTATHASGSFDRLQVVGGRGVSTGGTMTQAQGTPQFAN